MRKPTATLVASRGVCGHRTYRRTSLTLVAALVVAACGESTSTATQHAANTGPASTATQHAANTGPASTATQPAVNKGPAVNSGPAP
jgi:hypothetical protein